MSSAGYLLVGAGKYGRAASFRLVKHQGLEEVPTQNGRLLTFPDGAELYWLGWYAPSLVANCWEPYDQPLREAYLPLAYERLELRVVPDRALWLREPRAAPCKGMKLSKEDSFISEPTLAGIQDRLHGILVALGANEPLEGARFLTRQD